MTGTNCDFFTHKSSRSYLNHLVYTGLHMFKITYCVLNVISETDLKNVDTRPRHKQCAAFHIRNCCLPTCIWYPLLTNNKIRYSYSMKILSETFSCFAYSWTCSCLLQVTTSETTRQLTQLEQINVCATPYVGLLHIQCLYEWHAVSHVFNVYRNYVLMTCSQSCGLNLIDDPRMTTNKIKNIMEMQFLHPVSKPWARWFSQCSVSASL
jgi:hypothetical protein